MEKRKKFARLCEVGSDSLVAFVGCGKSKRRGRHKAIELYDGQYFRLCGAAARLLVDDSRLYVLSAKHGVLHSSDVIDDYDLKLDELSTIDLKTWRRNVKERIDAMIAMELQPVYVCGLSYHDGLPGEKLLPEIGMGHQIQFLQTLIRLRRSKGFGFQ